MNTAQQYMPIDDVHSDIVEILSKYLMKHAMKYIEDKEGFHMNAWPSGMAESIVLINQYFKKKEKENVKYVKMFNPESGNCSGRRN